MDDARKAAVEVAKRGYSLAMQTGGAPWQAAICAAIDAYERALWRPIAEAPRNKMLLLGHVEDAAPMIGYWGRGAWREHNGKGTVCKPTHFRPLPAGPNADGR